MRVTQWLLWLLSMAAAAVQAQRFDCDQLNCLRRERFVVKAIVHGNRDDPFWQEIHASMKQAAADMRITLDMELYSSLDPLRMANDIAAVAKSPPLPDVLIVSIPTASVQREVGVLVAEGQVPIFGLNSGSEVGRALGVLGHVSMNESMGGQAAGDQFSKLLSRQGRRVDGRGLYINHELGNSAFEQRFLGLQEALPNMQFDQANFFTSISDSDLRWQLLSQLKGCPYDVIQLAGASPLSLLRDALAFNDCPADVLIGAFDTNEEVYMSIQSSELAFTVSQQPHLQGAFALTVAVLYATTGQAVAQPSETSDGIYLAGPRLINRANLPVEALRVCESEAFPVCNSTLDPNGQAALCPCTDRRKIRIAGVTHGVTTDSFWDDVYAAMEQAALDFDVDLMLTRHEPEDSSELVTKKLINQIRHYCEQPIHGLFVSIPNPSVEAILRECRTKNIPIIGINAGAESAEKLGITFIGQLEHRAGYSAGMRLIEGGALRGLCPMHESNHTALLARCAGMKEAFDESNMTFVGAFDVERENSEITIGMIEDLVGESGSWSGYGILPLGQVLLPAMLQLIERHPDLLVGAFDSSELLFEAFEETDNILFGISQNSYLQGYLPIPLLAWNAYTRERLGNKFVESGPDFVSRCPSDEELQCQAISFRACTVEELSPVDADPGPRPRLSPGTIAGICVAAIGMVLLVLYSLYRVHRLSLHVRRLKEGGQTFPQISLARKMSCVLIPLDSVVARAQRETSMSCTAAEEDEKGSVPIDEGL